MGSWMQTSCDGAEELEIQTLLKLTTASDVKLIYYQKLGSANFQPRLQIVIVSTMFRITDL